VAPELLWRVAEPLAVIDGLIAGFNDERFVAQLPHLRLAFSALNPRETDEVAARIAARHGAGGGALQTPVIYGIAGEELRANLALSEKVRASLEADGLQDWATAGGALPWPAHWGGAARRRGCGGGAWSSGAIRRPVCGSRNSLGLSSAPTARWTTFTAASWTAAGCGRSAADGTARSTPRR